MTDPYHYQSELVHHTDPYHNQSVLVPHTDVHHTNVHHTDVHHTQALRVLHQPMMRHIDYYTSPTWEFTGRRYVKETRYDEHGQAYIMHVPEDQHQPIPQPLPQHRHATIPDTINICVQDVQFNSKYRDTADGTGDRHDPFVGFKWGKKLIRTKDKQNAGSTIAFNEDLVATNISREAAGNGGKITLEVYDDDGAYDLADFLATTNPLLVDQMTISTEISQDRLELFDKSGVMVGILTVLTQWTPPLQGGAGVPTNTRR